MFCCFPFLCQYFLLLAATGIHWEKLLSLLWNSIMVMWMRKPQAQSTQRWVIKGCINFGWPSLPWRGKERNVHGLASAPKVCSRISTYSSLFHYVYSQSSSVPNLRGDGSMGKTECHRRVAICCFKWTPACLSAPFWRIRSVCFHNGAQYFSLRQFAQETQPE